jgi:hypothetical protein
MISKVQKQKLMKKVYVPPNVIFYGYVRNLTQGGTGKAAEGSNCSGGGTGCRRP